MYFIDLFCGIGGMSYGLQAAGLEAITGIEIDPEACYVYQKFIQPTEKALNMDIREINPKNLPDVPVIVGCPPCQGFSNINGKGRKNKKKTKEML